MLRPEPGIDALVDELRALRRRDRDAVLARLPAEKARRMRALIHRQSEPDASSPFSSDIADRLFARDKASGAMTAKGCEALAQAAEAMGSVRPAARHRSLIDRIGGALGRGSA